MGRGDYQATGMSVVTGTCVMSAREVAEAIGVSKEMVLRIECAALRKLRARAARFGLRDLLDWSQQRMQRSAAQLCIERGERDG